uniref:CHY-type domain-containing protein n=1 Tax=Brassica oleracea var. oleracea TaxID=109376 RepID=A0A0D2ZS72_BRAOL
MDTGFQENEQNQELDSHVTHLMEISSGYYGCSHYRRRCKIRAPCCDEVFDCRHCHNEAKDSLQTEQLLRHDLPRHDVSKVICSLCGTEQDVQQNCSTCGVCMGKYFCSKCKFFDDDLSKKQYHCDDCGICRLSEYLHSQCFDIPQNCFDKYYTTTFALGVLKTLNIKKKTSSIAKDVDVATPKFWRTSTGVWKAHCITIARFVLRYTCPLCSKSICDMSSVWKKLDEEVAAYKIPKVYEDKMVWILCNDCGSNTDVRFHLIAHKCSSCGSYNTRKTQRGPNTHSYSSGVPQVVSSTG